MDLREKNLKHLNGGHFDLLIVGGGINGAVSAAALSARGLSVALVDRGDFAGFTSQESSNLVWGGFKYLENYELPLVWNLCSSRNRLLRAYPTQITEIDFVATLDKTAPFPSLLAGIGAFGYWGIGRFFTRPPKYLTPKAIEDLEPVSNTATAKGGIRYADAYLRDNDARFVWNFIRSALDAGATAANYVELESATLADGKWTATLRDTTTSSETEGGNDGSTFNLTADAIINAAGPFVDGLNQGWELKTKHRIVYSKGIHLIVPKLTDSERILAFFDDTGRLFYVIPMANRSVIGTTDTRTDQADEGVTDEDRTFLLEQINARLDLDTPLTTKDVIAERCGVRPLVVKSGGDDQIETDWTSLSRKHEMEIDRSKRVITLFGGKLTDCLNMGEEVMEAVEDLGFKLSHEDDSWFGEPDDEAREAFYTKANGMGFGRKPSIERGASMAEVLWRRHGEAASHVLALIRDDPRKGAEVIEGSDVLRAEVILMREREMITRLDDFLRRRTKLALTIGQEALDADPGISDLAELLALPSTLPSTSKP